MAPSKPSAPGLFAVTNADISLSPDAPRQPWWIYLLGAAAIVGCLLAGVYSAAYLFAGSAKAPAAAELPLANTRLLPAPMPVPGLALQIHTGQALERNLWLGKWNLVVFGFGSCPDFCPLTLSRLARLLREPWAKNLQLLFVTVDPERDSLANLASYVHFFHPDIIGVHGSNAELAQMARFFGASYERSAIVEQRLLRVPAGIDMPIVALNEQLPGNQYQVNHSSQIFIVNPQGEFVGYFPAPQDEQPLRQDLQLLMQTKGAVSASANR